jgi:hypothetical protein
MVVNLLRKLGVLNVQMCKKSLDQNKLFPKKFRPKQAFRKSLDQNKLYTFEHLKRLFNLSIIFFMTKIT